MPSTEQDIARNAGAGWLGAVGDSLAESRRAGLPFAQAWSVAIRTPHSAHGESPGDYRPELMAFAEEAFRRGYHREDVMRPVGLL